MRHLRSILFFVLGLSLSMSFITVLDNCHSKQPATAQIDSTHIQRIDTIDCCREAKALVAKIHAYYDSCASVAKPHRIAQDQRSTSAHRYAPDSAFYANHAAIYVPDATQYRVVVPFKGDSSRVSGKFPVDHKPIVIDVTNIEVQGDPDSMMIVHAYAGNWHYVFHRKTHQILIYNADPCLLQYCPIVIPANLVYPSAPPEMEINFDCAIGCRISLNILTRRITETGLQSGSYFRAMNAHGGYWDQTTQTLQRNPGK